MSIDDFHEDLKTISESQSVSTEAASNLICEQYPFKKHKRRSTCTLIIYCILGMIVLIFAILSLVLVIMIFIVK